MMALVLLIIDLSSTKCYIWKDHITSVLMNIKYILVKSIAFILSNRYASYICTREYHLRSVLCAYQLDKAGDKLIYIFLLISIFCII